MKYLSFITRLKKAQYIFLVAVIMLAFTNNTSAYCYVCIVGSGCGISDGICAGPHSGRVFSCEDIPLLKPNVDYIQKENGKAWIVQGNKKTPLISDKLASFITRINIKYAKAAQDDKNLPAQIDAECIAFLKTDDGIIGARRLALISKETGLKVRDFLENKRR
ncbi:MAG: hypothetical protein Q8L04_09570 [Ignavibacteria bacterium]|nr:hypothetical protein [Ignavibacteria bacterium]